MSDAQANPNDPRNTPPLVNTEEMASLEAANVDYQALMDRMDAGVLNAGNFGSLDDSIPHDADVNPQASSSMASSADHLPPSPHVTPAQAPDALRRTTRPQQDNKTLDDLLVTLTDKTTAAGKLHFMQGALREALHQQDNRIADRAAANLSAYLHTFRDYPDALGWESAQVDSAIAHLDDIHQHVRNDYFAGAQQIMQDSLIPPVGDLFKPLNRKKEEKVEKEFSKYMVSDSEAVLAALQSIVHERETYLGLRDETPTMTQSGQSDVIPSTGNRALDTFLDQLRHHSTPVGQVHSMQESLRTALGTHDHMLADQAVANLSRYLMTFRKAPGTLGWTDDQWQDNWRGLQDIQKLVRDADFAGATQIMNGQLHTPIGEKFKPDSDINEAKFLQALGEYTKQQPQAILDIQDTIAKTREACLRDSAGNTASLNDNEEDRPSADPSLAQSMPPDNDPLHKFLEKTRNDTTPAGKLYVMFETLKATIQAQNTDLSLKTMNDMRRYLHTFPDSAASVGLQDSGLMRNVAALEALDKALMNENYTAAQQVLGGMTAPQGDYLKPNAGKKETFSQDLEKYLKTAPEKIVDNINLITKQRVGMLANHNGRVEAQERSPEKAKKEGKEEKQQSSGGGSGGFSFSLDLGLGRRGNKESKPVNANALEKFLAERKAAKLGTNIPSPAAMDLDAQIGECEKLITENNNIVKGLKQHKQMRHHFENWDRVRYDENATSRQRFDAKTQLEWAIEDEQNKPNSHFANQQKKLGKNADRLSDLIDGMKDKVENDPKLSKERRNELQQLSQSMEKMMGQLEGTDDGIDKTHPDDKGKMEKLKEKMAQLMETVARVIEKLVNAIKLRLSVN